MLNFIFRFLFVFILGYFIISTYIVGGVAVALGIYLPLPIGPILSVIVAFFIASAVYSSVSENSDKNKIINGSVVTISIGVLVASALFFSAFNIINLPDSISDFDKKAWNAVIPDQKTKDKHMSAHEKECKRDVYCDNPKITQDLRDFYNSVGGKSYYSCWESYSGAPCNDYYSMIGAVAKYALIKKFNLIRDVSLELRKNIFTRNDYLLRVNIVPYEGELDFENFTKQICDTLNKSKLISFDTTKVGRVQFYLEDERGSYLMTDSTEVSCPS